MTSASLTSLGSYFLPTTTVYSTLEVAGGLHRGVVVPLEQPICRIGSDHHADVILSDPGIADEHVTLRFHARMVAIEALGSDIRVGDKRLAQGTGWRTNLPVTITFGDVVLQLSRPSLSGPLAYQPIHKAGSLAFQSLLKSGISIYQISQKAGMATFQSTRNHGSHCIQTIQTSDSPILQFIGKTSAPALGYAHRTGSSIFRSIRGSSSAVLRSISQRMPEPLRARLDRKVTVSALCTLIGFFGVYAFINTGEAGANISADALHSTANLNPQAAEAAMALAASTLAPGKALSQRLAQAGLDGLQVNDTGSHLVVTGEFAADQYTTWNDVRRWFDGQYGSDPVLISDAQPSPAADEPAFEFRAVWLGDNPYVIGENGQRLYPGAALREGWVLSDIGDGRVMLRRGDQEFSLTL